MYLISELIRTFDISDNPKLVFYFTKEKESPVFQLAFAKIYIFIRINSFITV